MSPAPRSKVAAAQHPGLLIGSQTESSHDLPCTFTSKVVRMPLEALALRVVMMRPRVLAPAPPGPVLQRRPVGLQRPSLVSAVLLTLVIARPGEPAASHSVPRPSAPPVSHGVVV